MIIYGKNIEKTFEYPKGYLENYLKQEYFRQNNAHIETLPLKDLDNYEGIETYHVPTWGDDRKKYRFDSSKIRNWGMSAPYVIRSKDGKMRLGDGRHRMFALMNEGYTHAPILVIDR